MRRSRWRAVVSTISATVSLNLLLATVATAADPAAPYQWPPSLTVELDLDRSGRTDSARLGIAQDSIALLVSLDSQSLPLIEIPIDGSRQFGICPGRPPEIRVVARSEAPGHALGETPQGYEICPDCFEIVVSGGECDPLHFFWNGEVEQLNWWRA